jgi:hypothetical protein
LLLHSKIKDIKKSEISIIRLFVGADLTSPRFVGIFFVWKILDCEIGRKIGGGRVLKVGGGEGWKGGRAEGWKGVGKEGVLEGVEIQQNEFEWRKRMGRKGRHA